VKDDGSPARSNGLWLIDLLGGEERLPVSNRDPADGGSVAAHVNWVDENRFVFQELHGEGSDSNAVSEGDMIDKRRKKGFRPSETLERKPWCAS